MLRSSSGRTACASRANGSRMRIISRTPMYLSGTICTEKPGGSARAELPSCGVTLPRTARLAIAAVLLMAATVLVNLTPPNPYLADTLKVWQQGHFLNFNGLTRLVSALWPFAALGYLMFLATRRLK